jgi:hypothetical protein
MPNPVADDSERAEGKSKKREGFRKPNTEPAPSRTLNFRHIDAQDVMYCNSALCISGADHGSMVINTVLLLLANICHPRKRKMRDEGYVIFS